MNQFFWEKMKNIILFLLVLISQLFAQEQFRFKKLNQDHGLSSNSVQKIFQDSLGFIWIGTQDGLNRFDGFNFKLYTSGKDSSNLKGKQIISAIVDPENNIWIGTKDNGVNKISYNTNIINKFPPAENGEEGLTDGNVMSIISSRDGRVYFGTRSGGLNYLDEVSGEIKQRGAADLKIMSMHYTPENKLIIGTENKQGLYLLDCSSEELKSIELPGNVKPDILTISEGINGNILIGSNEGVYCVNSGSYTYSEADTKIFSKLKGRSITSFAIDQEGNTWIGTKKSGLYLLNKAGKLISMEDYNFPAKRIETLLADKQGMLWIGTYNMGVFIYDKLLSAFNLLTNVNGRNLKLSDFQVSSMAEDSYGKIWIGTWEGGINIFDRKEKEIKLLTSENGLSGDAVFSLFSDSKGYIWAGTWGFGLNKIDPVSNKIQIYRHEKGKPGTLSNNYIFAVEEDNIGNIYAGAFHGGLNVLDKKKGEWHQPDLLKGEVFSVISILMDKKQRLWLGTLQNGVICYNTISGETRNYREGEISNNEVLSLALDGKGNIWAGTDAGLNRITPGNERINIYTTENGLPNSTINGLVFEDSVKLWISTNNGLIKMDTERGKFFCYTTKDGLPSNEFIQSGYFKDNSGTIFFASSKGLVYFTPDDLRTNGYIPPLYITDFEKYYKSVDLGASVYNLEKIGLNYSDYLFGFQFAMLDYRNPSSVSYSYYIEGLYNDWITLGQRHEITLMDMSPGAYTLTIRADARDSGVKEIGLDLNISPPFWQTIWFILLMVLILSAVIYLVIKAALERDRMKIELNAARDMQMKLIPEKFPQSDKLKVWGECIPTYEVGGDAFDVFWMDKEKNRLAVTTSDVSGKGMKASMALVMANGMMHQIVDTGIISPADVLTKLNKSLKKHKPEKKQFAAVNFGIFDLIKREFIFSSAGQPEIIRVRNRKAKLLATRDPRVPAGTIDLLPYVDEIIDIENGDLFAFYSDAFPETLNKSEEQYGYDRMFAFLETNSEEEPQKLVKRMIKELNKYAGKDNQYDDTTLLIVRICG